MATIEGQVRIRVAREENRAEVDFEGDGLHPAVHADVPLRWRTQTRKAVNNRVRSVVLRQKVDLLWDVWSSSPGNRLWKLASQLYPLNWAPAKRLLLNIKRIKNIFSISAPGGKKEWKEKVFKLHASNLAIFRVLFNFFFTF